MKANEEFAEKANIDNQKAFEILQALFGVINKYLKKGYAVEFFDLGYIINVKEKKSKTNTKQKKKRKNKSLKKIIKVKKNIREFVKTLK